MTQMRLEPSPEQAASREAFRAFVDEAIAPHAGQYDRDEGLPEALVRELGRRGYLGAIIPEQYGGGDMDFVTFGMLHEEIGRGCSSTRSLLTVHSMAAHALARWGTVAQQKHWLPGLATGELIGAFALTEPEAGSDALSISTTATAGADGFVLNGRKRWITFGQIADLFLAFARLDDSPAMFLLPRSSPGLTITPMRGVFGTRGSMLAELTMEDCHIAATGLLRRPGFGFGSFLSAVLDIGRYSVACGCVGIAQACLEASLDYTAERKQFGVPLRQHQLISRMLTDMITGVRAARLLCYQAGDSKRNGDPRTVADTLVAKYFASTTAVKIALDAVQIHGARGCSEEYPVERYLRDAKVMEIIEGSSQIQQLLIARHGA